MSRQKKASIGTIVAVAMFGAGLGGYFLHQNGSTTVTTIHDCGTLGGVYPNCTHSPGDPGGGGWKLFTDNFTINCSSHHNTGYRNATLTQWLYTNSDGTTVVHNSTFAMSPCHVGGVNTHMHHSHNHGHDWQMGSHSKHHEHKHHEGKAKSNTDDD